MTGARPVPSDADPGISLFTIAEAIVRWRRTIVLLAGLGALAGATVAFLTPRRYASRVTFIPQTNDQPSSGLALAASQFGIRIPNDGGRWGPPVYVDLLRSRSLLVPLLSDTFTVREEGDARRTLLDLLEVKPGPEPQRLEQGFLRLRQVVSAGVAGRISGVELSVSTPWPSVSLELAERLIRAVNDFNLETWQFQARAERQFVEGQTRAAELALREAEDRLETFQRRNRRVDTPELQFERDRLQRDVSLRQAEYTSLRQSYAEARIREVRDTPVISVLEAPSLPVNPESRHLVPKVAMGLLLGVLAALLLRTLGAARRSPDPTAREFFATLDDATPRFLRRRS